MRVSFNGYGLSPGMFIHKHLHTPMISRIEIKLNSGYKLSCMHKENRELNYKKTHREFGNNSKSQGIQVVNSQILKIKDIVIFAAEYYNFSKELNAAARSVCHMKPSQITEIGTGKIAV